MLSFFMSTPKMKSRAVIVLVFFFVSCQSGNKNTFDLLEASETSILFSNDLQHSEQFNTYTYRNFYNGAGVATGDINNDGLIDLYFTGNQVDNRLYLNKGNFQFKDITEQAGVSCPGVWSTGVSMADVNGDGWLDIYVCKSGPQEGSNRFNELFINNGDLTFTEKSSEYRLNDIGLSNHAVFFDYDRDNDLDFYLLNNSGRSVGIYDLWEGQREVRDTLGGNKLYRNDGQYFTDVSEEAGIYGSSIGFGLGVTASDINGDGWPDLFVSNDFFERDYLYINQMDGSFKESMTAVMTETSLGSMGADIADINNDLKPDIFVSEMLPESWERAKSKSTFEDWDKHQANIKNGFHRQYSRNVLQLNRGRQSGDAKPYFSELSRLTYLHATDWSWGSLTLDYDNDGNKEGYVANGIVKDLIDQDYINFRANSSLEFSKYKKDSLLLTKLIESIPSQPIPNYLFKNEGKLSFTNVTEDAGLSEPTFSNGAIYADLDNDGDLDLIVNNINQPAQLFRNLTSQATENTYLNFKLIGDNRNTSGIGAKITVYDSAETFYIEHYPVKGYMSSVDPRPHLGLGNRNEVDSVTVEWPDGRFQSFENVLTGQTLQVDQKDAHLKKKPVIIRQTLLREIYLGVSIKHTENDFVDFNRDRLLFEMYSNLGPKLATGDLNGDGRDDLVLGGAVGFSTRIFQQTGQATFDEVRFDIILDHSDSEDSELAVADIDGNGSLDISVASGGNEFSRGDFSLRDRVYLFGMEDGIHSRELPAITSTSFICPIDFDNDGDLDLVTGDRLLPFEYGLPGALHMYKNDGAGNFEEVSREFLNDFQTIGLLTDAKAIDYDGDNDMDLVIVGEWMPIILLENVNGHFKIDSLSISNNFTGHWKTVEVADFNDDGIPDLFVGNSGENTRLKGSPEEPLTMYVGDFDGNGRLEHITCIYENGKQVPIHQRQDLIKQLPNLARKFNDYASYSKASIFDLIDKSILDTGIKLEAQTLSSKLYLSNAQGTFEPVKMPIELQFSSVFAADIVDVNADGLVDLLVGGNQSRIKPEFGANLGTYGQVFINRGAEGFEFLDAEKSGLLVKGEVRDIEHIKVGDRVIVLFALNNDVLKAYEVGNF